MKSYLKIIRKSNQTGSVIVVVIIGVIITIAVIVFGFFLLNPATNKQTTDKTNSIKVDDSKIDVKKSCKNRDYGGCDEEKNFYRWKDDGKP